MKKVIKKKATKKVLVDPSKVGVVSVAKLVKAPWNYKTDDTVMLAKLVANLRRNGQLELVKVRDLPDGSLEVVDGNHRVDAFNILGWTSVLAYRLGEVTVEDAQRIALELNETRFRSDHLRIAEIVGSLSAKYPMDDLESTLPYSRDDLQSYLDTVQAEAVRVAAEQGAAAAEALPPENQDAGRQLVLRLGVDDAALWSDVRAAFSMVTDVDEEIFRTVCRAYLSGSVKKK